MSDNGADFTDTSRINLPFRAWYRHKIPGGRDALGGHDSYAPRAVLGRVSVHAAGADQTSPGEGGMRVPFILATCRRR